MGGCGWAEKVGCEGDAALCHFRGSPEPRPPQVPDDLRRSRRRTTAAMLALALLQPLAYVHSPLISRGPAQISRVSVVTASAKILPVVDVGLCVVVRGN